MKKKTVTVRVVSKSLDGAIVEPQCKQAQRFCQIASTPYLTVNQLVHIQKLGFEIKVISL
ncbi:MAG: hypothetical protein ACSNEK_06570 [Parachlamydiaceae bacterium]